MICHSGCKHLLLVAIQQFLNLGDNESVIVSPVITIHTLRKKGEIKKMSVLTRLPSSLIALLILNWINC